MAIEMTEEQKVIYLAAVMDCEGCFGIQESSGGYYLARLVVGITDEVLPIWLQENFGGTINKHVQRKKNWKPAFYWNLCRTSDVEQVVMKIYPYLKIKKKHAAVILSFVNSAHEVGGEQFYLQMKELNKKGVEVG